MKSGTRGKGKILKSGELCTGGKGWLLILGGKWRPNIRKKKRGEKREEKSIKENFIPVKGKGSQ